MSELLKGRVAVVTGGGSGLGAATVARFIDEGAFVFVVDRSGQQEEVASSYAASAEAIHADVTSANDIRAIFARVTERFGRLDVLCNNAGYGGDAADILPIEQCRDEHFDDMLDVNLRSTLLAIKYAVPLLKAAGGGSIINWSSTAALIAHPNMAAYAAAKGGITAMTPTLARELGPYNIRVNAICPGPIVTPMLAPYIQDKDALAAFVERTALKRLGKPVEVANVALFLASEQSSFVTGAVLTVDGGQSA